MSIADLVLQEEMQRLYSNHHAWLYAWLRKKLGCAHNAADVAQDTFVRLMASRNVLLGIQEPRAYLTTTAKRLLMDRSRHQLIEQAYRAEMALVAAALPGHPSPEDTWAAVQALEQIGAALAQVSAKAREAFLLHYLEQQTHAAIAQQLSVSTRMVQKYLVQALLQCRLQCPALAV